MPRSPFLVPFRGDTCDAAPRSRSLKTLLDKAPSRLWFASAWLAGEIPARTPLTYREAKKSRNVRDEIEKNRFQNPNIRRELCGFYFPLSLLSFSLMGCRGFSCIVSPGIFDFHGLNCRRRCPGGALTGSQRRA